MAELTIPEPRELGLAAISNLSNDSADELIGRVVGLRDEEHVSAFLRDNPFLSRLILEARAEIRKYFPESPLFLEVLNDSEGVDPETLYLFISTDLSPAEARSRLRELDSQWWLAAVGRARGRLCISLEYE